MTTYAIIFQLHFLFVWLSTTGPTGACKMFGLQPSMHAKSCTAIDVLTLVFGAITWVVCTMLVSLYMLEWHQKAEEEMAGGKGGDTATPKPPSDANKTPPVYVNIV